MALDWGKDISFLGLRKGRSRQVGSVPSKTSMNLVATEDQPLLTRSNVLSALALVVVLALFLKFGVFDFYGRLDAKQAELSGQQAVLSSLEAQLADYDDLRAEYESYEVGLISDEAASIDVDAAFRLVENCVEPYAAVSSMGLVEDELRLMLADTSLDRIGALSGLLEQQPEVQEVSISNASAKQADGGVSCAVTVKLQPVDDGREA